jgi:hypothetical protein
MLCSSLAVWSLRIGLIMVSLMLKVRLVKRFFLAGGCCRTVFDSLDGIGPAQWRFPIAFQAVFIVVVIGLINFIPESPRWLQKRGRKEESKTVIARLTGKGVGIDDARVLKLYNDIEEAINLESVEGPFKYKELFQHGRLQNFRRMCLCAAVDAFQQLSG